MKLKDLHEAGMKKAKSILALKRSIVDGHFTQDGSDLDADSCDLSQKGLVSLVGAPSVVNGEFSCSYNRLTSLEGAPTKVTGKFTCHRNHLATLKGGPSYVGGDFDCTVNNDLKSLVGAPDYVGDSFYCNFDLESLEGIPAYIGKRFMCAGTKVKSLKDIHRHLKELGGQFDCRKTPITSNVLGLLLVKGIKSVNNETFGDILTDTIKQHQAEDQKSLKQRLVVASRRLADELGEKGKALAQL